MHIKYILGSNLILAGVYINNIYMKVSVQTITDKCPVFCYTTKVQLVKFRSIILLYEAFMVLLNP